MPPFAMNVGSRGKSGSDPDIAKASLLTDFVVKVGGFRGFLSVIRSRATGFDLPALTLSTQLSRYAMH
jgi:hypothetical protein